MNKVIGQKIKAVRESKNLNAKSVADAIGILDTSLSKIEREGTNSVSTLLKIAHVLKVNVSVFFEETAKGVLKEPKSEYGYATKAELTDITHSITKLTKIVERIEDQLQLSATSKTRSTESAKNSKKKYGKK